MSAAKPLPRTLTDGPDIAFSGTVPAGPVFASLRQARRVWAVAAIHGEAGRLGKLHGILGQRLRPGDRLVYLGNYLGVGPDIVGVVDELLAFRRELLCAPGAEPEDIVFLRGAQEEMWRKLLELQFATAPAEVLEWMLGQGADATLAAYGGSAPEGWAVCRQGPLATTRWTGRLRAAMHACPGHDELMANLRRAAFTAGGELLFVHAGVDPHRPLTEQGDAFWWGNGYFDEMSEPYCGFRRVISGYDRKRRPAHANKTIAAIDGGCGFGGQLNAACFDLTGAAVDWISV